MNGSLRSLTGFVRNLRRAAGALVNQVSWANVRPGDIVQFVTGSNEHTLIITGGNSPSTATVVDSNSGLNGLVSRGTFASRAVGFNNGNYIIWRLRS